MEKLSLRPHYGDQLQIMLYGRRVGYTSSRPKMPVCFLSKKLAPLTPAEKTEVIAYCIEQLGSRTPTPQTKEFWPRDGQAVDV